MATLNAGTDDPRTKPEKKPFNDRSTGFRLFLILSLALLPLGLIAFLATLQSSRTADLEKRAQMRIALTETARQIATILVSDTSLTRVTMRAREAHPDDPDRCARFREIIGAQTSAPPRFAMFGAESSPWCASADFRPARPTTLTIERTPAQAYALDPSGLSATVSDAGGAAVGLLHYTPAHLRGAASKSDQYSLSIIGRDATLPIMALAATGTIAGYETLTAPIGNTGLTIEMTMARSPFTAVELLSFLLPFAMWALAALIAWIVVDRILVRPLRALERSVSGYTPGEPVTPPRLPDASALEIRQLAGTFHGFVETIATHDSELAAGLARQTRLTREVHHRVKNNLQVVASLINLHARGQTMPEVVRAYASIQRRVDALAVVHRNHYAELEENRGVSLRSLVGELAQNIRGSLPDHEEPPPITLDICACYVTQDIAVPVAFLLTELIELAMQTDVTAPISVVLTMVNETLARVSVTSQALRDTPAIAARMENRFARVLEGLSRQLRSPLERDSEHGRFSLEIAIVSQ